MNGQLGFSPQLIEFMSQTGRFDLVSLLLTIIGLILVAGGIFAFLNLRRVARETAKEEAATVAEAKAERVTNEYLQAELPDLMEAYRGFFDSEDAISDEDADRMANAQEDGESK
ncbi:MAG: hypothetical protein HKN18_00995 [Silicimonas sp.]|nr:hypothetical protein [Silicimonas sp.]